MSIALLNDLRKLALAKDVSGNAVLDLSSTEYGTLKAYLQYADSDGTSIYPSDQTVADELRLHRKTICVNRKSLISKGWLIVKEGAAHLRKKMVFNVQLLKQLLDKYCMKEQSVTQSNTSVTQSNTTHHLPECNDMRIKINEEMERHGDLVTKLRKYEVKWVCIEGWFGRYGADKIRNQIALLGELMAAGRDIRNPGAYLGEMLKGNIKAVEAQKTKSCGTTIKKEKIRPTNDVDIDWVQEAIKKCASPHEYHDDFADLRAGFSL